MTMNLRCDDTFVLDEGWYRASERYADFLRRHKGAKQHTTSPLIFESASRQIRGLVFWVSVFGQRPPVWRPFCIGSTTN